MAEVVLFNHVPKTAGSTMKEVLWSALGGGRVYFAMGFHEQRVPEVRRRLENSREEAHAVVAHTGYGLHERLPDRHDYRMFTILRDPVERTVSEFFFMRDARGKLPAEMSLEEFLERDLARSHNCHTAFLGGLTLAHHLDGLELDRSKFDRALLERAKRNLEAHEVVGLTERFDETLLLLRRAFGWPLVKTLYRPANVGPRGARPTLGERQLEAVRDSNRLDFELFEFGRGLFEARLAAQAPASAREVRRFRRWNSAYRRAYPLSHLPVRTLVRSARRLRGASATA